MLWTTTMIPIPHIDWTLTKRGQAVAWPVVEAFRKEVAKTKEFACSHHNDDTQFLSSRREDGDGLALGIEWSRGDGQRVYRKD